jgi:pescadillo
MFLLQGKQAPVDEALEDKELSMTMMNKKSKRLYSRMQYGIEKKQEQTQKLVDKRRKLEEAPAAEPTATQASGKRKRK